MKNIQILTAPLAGSGAPAPAAAPSSPPVGVPLPETLERLIFFNGRFLNAQDLSLEAKDRLLRAALAQRAQGAGVSYGFHAVAAASAGRFTKGNVFTAVASDLWAKIKSDPTWMRYLGGGFAARPVTLDTPQPATAPQPTDDASQIAQLAGAMEKICKLGDGGAGGEAAITVAPGHASDGYGNDLYLDQTIAVKLSDLIAAFRKSPSRCVVPGPTISPQPMASASSLTGAFLLTAYLYSEDKGQVPIYGVQCGDNNTQPCSYGYHYEGVALRLVFFDALSTSTVKPGDPLPWRGAGARAYFKAETAARGSKLPSLMSALPFDAPAEAPDGGDHVPLGMIYLSNGALVAYDEWTAKRLRTPAELDYWLRALLNPSKPAQVARVVQFESQLTDGLGGKGAASLWDLGFAAGNTLVLPGVGFLPVPLSTTTIGADEVTAIDAAVGSFLDGVPYRLMPATAGELNGIFTGAIESGELRLTRPLVAGPSVFQKLAEIQKYAPAIDQLLQQYDSSTSGSQAPSAPPPAPPPPPPAPSPATGPTPAPSTTPTSGAVTSSGFNVKTEMLKPEIFVESVGKTLSAGDLAKVISKFTTDAKPAPQPPQLYVWYPTTGYQGWVMFTWPAADTQTATGDPHLCVSVGVVKLDSTNPAEYIAITGTNTTFAYGGTHRDMDFRDDELAGPARFVAGNLELPRGLLDGFRVAVDPAYGDLKVSCEASFLIGRQRPQEVRVGPGADGWIRPPAPTSDSPRLMGFRIRLGGARAKDFDVRYRARFTLINEKRFSTVETEIAQNGAACGIDSPDLSSNEDLRAAGFMTHLHVRVVPRGRCGQTPSIKTGTVRLDPGHGFLFDTEQKVNPGSDYDIWWNDLELVPSHHQGIVGGMYPLGKIASPESVTALDASRFVTTPMDLRNPTAAKGNGYGCRIAKVGAAPEYAVVRVADISTDQDNSKRWISLEWLYPFPAAQVR